ncbi:hypothetical protein HDU78_009985 [Chytriomyces hyalinus]|nr:hypothetical protein HDU78_009985 [Chytriomyces hyalinus]
MKGVAVLCYHHAVDPDTSEHDCDASTHSTESCEASHHPAHTHSSIQSIHGHFVNLNPQSRSDNAPSIALTAAPASNPPASHPCCYNKRDTPVFWDVAVHKHQPTSSALDSSAPDFIIPNIQQMPSGGDALVLDTDHSDWVVKNPDTASTNTFSFRTRILKSGDDAQAAMRKYFTWLLAAYPSDTDWIICIGDMCIETKNKEE